MGSEYEFLVIGLTCNLVGIFLLANSIVFRSPRRLIEEYFSVGPISFRPIRDYVLNKIQVVIGFLFLTAGFILQALTAWSQIGTSIKIICAVLVAFASAIYLFGAKYSRHSFRKYLIQFFQRHPYDFLLNIDVTKQIGKAFGIAGSPEDSVELYVAKVMLALGLDPTKPRSDLEEQPAQRLREMAPLPMPLRHTPGTMG